MSLKKQIEKVVGEDGAVGEEFYTEEVTERKMAKYSVNYKGIVLQYVIAQEEDDPGVIEDFLEHIEATTKEVAR